MLNINLVITTVKAVTVPTTTSHTNTNIFTLQQCQHLNLDSVRNTFRFSHLMTRYGVLQQIFNFACVIGHFGRI